MERTLDPRSVSASRLAGAITLAVILGPGLLLTGGFVLLAPWSLLQKTGLLVTASGLAGLLITWVLAWPALRFRHTRYQIDEGGLTIRRGVVWRSVTTVPTSRVQHTDVLQGPLERQFELATLVVHTAGTQNASVALGGIAHPDALALRDTLVTPRDDDTVDSALR